VRARLLMWTIAGLFRLLSLPFVRFEFRGGSGLHDRPAWILSANHRSVFDFPHAVIGLAHWRKDARILIASEFFANPAYGWACRAIDAIPMYRQTDPRGSFSAAVAALREGHSICIMPEGKLTWDPDRPLELGPFKTGASRMDTGADVPVRPIALVGGERVWPRGRKLPTLSLRRRTVLCWVADEPLWLAGDDHRANAAKLREVQGDLLRRATAELQRIDPTYLPDLQV
jgi:1-acyl-sn-glycerol-3-phosphate acyltransferase